MTSPYLGQIMMFAGNFAPSGWAFCNGTTMAINQNTALFALLGTNYGGNGVTTFQLPNLQSQLPVNQGTGPGLSTYVIGQFGGVQNVTVLYNQMPLHNHTLNAANTPATTASLSNALPAVPSGTGHFYSLQGTGPALTINQLNQGVCGTAGSSIPHTNLMPSLCITFVIALTGIFPSRN
jgi:microcystin-dependent protein